jgi:hypothetical protein
MRLIVQQSDKERVSVWTLNRRLSHLSSAMMMVDHDDGRSLSIILAFVFVAPWDIMNSCHLTLNAVSWVDLEQRVCMHAVNVTHV